MKVTLEPGKRCGAVANQGAQATLSRAERLCHAQLRSGSGAECARSRKRSHCTFGRRRPRRSR